MAQLAIAYATDEIPLESCHSLSAMTDSQKRRQVGVGHFGDPLALHAPPVLQLWPIAKLRNDPFRVSSRDSPRSSCFSVRGCASYLSCAAT
jgi:hypothetical protein